MRSRTRVVRDMVEGATILCKKGALQWMITEKPYCTVNDVETKALAWGQETMIPLQPNMPYRLLVAFPYMGKKATMPAEMTLTLKPGEVARFEYKTASTMFSKGKVTRVQ